MPKSNQTFALKIYRLVFAHNALQCSTDFHCLKTVLWCGRTFRNYYPFYCQEKFQDNVVGLLHDCAYRGDPVNELLIHCVCSYCVAGLRSQQGVPGSVRINHQLDYCYQGWNNQIPREERLEGLCKKEIEYVEHNISNNAKEKSDLCCKEMQSQKEIEDVEPNIPNNAKEKPNLCYKDVHSENVVELSSDSDEKNKEFSEDDDDCVVIGSNENEDTGPCIDYYVNGNVWICNLCDKTIKSKGALSTHAGLHFNESESWSWQIKSTLMKETRDNEPDHIQALTRQEGAIAVSSSNTHKSVTTNSQEKDNTDTFHKRITKSVKIPKTKVLVRKDERKSKQNSGEQLPNVQVGVVDSNGSVFNTDSQNEAHVTDKARSEKCCKDVKSKGVKKLQQAGKLAEALVIKALRPCEEICVNGVESNQQAQCSSTGSEESVCGDLYRVQSDFDHNNNDDDDDDDDDGDDDDEDDDNDEDDYDSIDDPDYDPDQDGEVTSVTSEFESDDVPKRSINQQKEKESAVRTPRIWKGGRDRKVKRHRMSSDIQCGRKEKVTRHRLSSVRQYSDTETSSDEELQSPLVSTSSLSSSSKNIKVQVTNNIGKRKWDKQYYCVYCENPYAKLPRHFEQKHSNEVDVCHALSYPKGSKQRKMCLKRLANKGNHAHNMKVMEKGEGCIAVKKRPTYEVSGEDYLPCEHCLAYFVKKDLWRHDRVCTMKPANEKAASYRRVQARSSLLLPLSKDISKGLSDNVLCKMNVDKISLVARSDPLILQFGEKLYKKHGPSGQYQYVTQPMRDLGRFVIKIREVTNDSCSTLTSCIQPQKFDTVVSCVRLLSGYDEVKSSYKVPSLATKLGNTLRKCAIICKGNAIKQEDEALEERAERFLQLTDMNWVEDISSNAQRTMNERKRKKAKYLPLVSDVAKLHKYMRGVASETKKQLKADDSNEKKWGELCRVTLAQLILFNRRRSGEMSRMSVEDYGNIHGGNDDQRVQDINSCLSAFEESLCKKMKIVHIRGKRGRDVPVILSSDLKAQIDLLMETREKVGINPRNQYVFACLKDSEMPVRGSTALHKYALSAELKAPDIITSTRLRKQMATLSQVLNLKENEQDIIAGFMGHNLQIHREYYRLPEQTLQVAKVGRLLIALEKGNIAEFRGKPLEDIEVDSYEVTEDEEEEDEKSENMESPGPLELELKGSATVGQVEISDNPSHGIQEDNERDVSVLRNKGLGEVGIDPFRNPYVDTEAAHGAGMESEAAHGAGMETEAAHVAGTDTVAADSAAIDTKAAHDADSKRRKTWRKWTKEEHEAVVTYFQQAIRLQKVPGKDKCVACQKKYPILHGKKWSDIKYHVYNKIKGKK
ncbi:uncharacterized protein [Ptychodera flava]|uniref:uncharacterized protein isoform X3 n=1 Tax=Ptychodera flava TaxID=63121 RepID=UPI00396A730C